MNIIISALPLLFASLGALWTELVGALGIFIEGFMNIGAFFTYIFMVKTGSVSVSVFMVGLLCASAGFLSARWVRVSKSNPFIIGLALNLASDGVTSVLSQAWFGTKGVLRGAGLFESRPFSPEPFIIGAGLCFALSAFLIRQTRFGLRLRGAGIAINALAERGIDGMRYQEAAWAVASALAGVAGACLTLRIGAYIPGGVAGRGWIALASVYLGFRFVRGTALAALVFASVEYAGITLQSVSSLPATSLLGVPSIAALVFYLVSCVIKKNAARSDLNTER